MATMKDLEQRVEAIEGLIGDLHVRMSMLWDAAENPGPPPEDRVAADKALVSRLASTREEAIAQQAARERLAELGLIDAYGRLLPQPKPNPADEADSGEETRVE